MVFLLDGSYGFVRRMRKKSVLFGNKGQKNVWPDSKDKGTTT